jgi:hypothetical protein
MTDKEMKFHKIMDDSIESGRRVLEEIVTVRDGDDIGSHFFMNVRTSTYDLDEGEFTRYNSASVVLDKSQALDLAERLIRYANS